MSKCEQTGLSMECNMIPRRLLSMSMHLASTAVEDKAGAERVPDDDRTGR